MLSMPVATYVVLREAADGRKLWEGRVSPSDEARVWGLMEAGLVVLHSRMYVATDAGEQVVRAVVRSCPGDMWPANGLIQVDVKAIGW
ncbi:hypothetical protein VT03_15115 [Planctomyces sp. SH-PL14]|nr:hypothetical protein VT03_15115 [Planctomyces sp. SH-PL14]